MWYIVNLFNNEQANADFELEEDSLDDISEDDAELEISQAQAPADTSSALNQSEMVSLDIDSDDEKP